MSLPVKVWSVQSRAGRTGASLAGVAATRGPKRRQRLDGGWTGCGIDPEIGMLRRQSWRPHQRKPHIRSRHARDWVLRRTIAEEARRCETPTIFAPGLLRPKGGSKMDEATFTPMGSIAT